MRVYLQILSLGLFLGFLSGCRENSPPPVMEAPLPAETRFSLRLDEAVVATEIAISQAEMSRGLMYRESLPEDAGMLFVYEEPQQLSFWMANTLIPLHIGYFDSEGILQEIHRMYPNDTRRVASRGDHMRFALEVNLGWFAARGIAPGSQLNLEDVREALTARGADPALYLEP